MNKIEKSGNPGFGIRFLLQGPGPGFEPGGTFEILSNGCDDFLLRRTIHYLIKIFSILNSDMALLHSSHSEIFVAVP
jgi:hypothetical protein